MNWLQWIKAVLGENHQYTAEEVEQILYDASQNKSQYGWDNSSSYQPESHTAQSYYEELVKQGWDEIDAYNYTKKTYGL